jgi:DASH family cryptochrome
MLYLFTQDLRVGGNPGVHQILKYRTTYDVIAVFVWPVGRSKAAQAWLAEAVINLRQRLEELGIQFVVLRDGEPTTWNRLIQAWPRSSSNSPPTMLAMNPHNERDRRQVLSVAQSIFSNQLIFVDEANLLSEELFEQVGLMPQSLVNGGELRSINLSFSRFRRSIQAIWPEVLHSILMDPLAEVGKSVPSQNHETQRSVLELPGLVDLILDDRELLLMANNCRRAFGLSGGESAAWQRLQTYFWELGVDDLSPPHGVKVYKDTRNGMLDRDDSSKLSPYLSWGCLSARQVARELARFEEQSISNESTQWFWQELLWREYFRWIARGAGNRIFSTDALRTSAPKPGDEWKDDEPGFELWRSGQTGEDFVDANMRELAETGWMSNRGRQNVASYLAKVLRINWTWGAQHFENELIDSDRPNNWGNWMYLAGVGTDPRDRVFNVSRQAEMYDESGAYRRRWLGSGRHG